MTDKPSASERQTVTLEEGFAITIELFKTVQSENAALTAEVAELKVKQKTFPIQSERGAPPHPTRIPWGVADLAYSVYSSRYGRDQSIERLAERGGFSPSEMDTFLPDWRKRCDERDELKARVFANEFGRLNAKTPDSGIVMDVMKRENDELRAEVEILKSKLDSDDKVDLLKWDADCEARDSWYQEAKRLVGELRKIVSLETAPASWPITPYELAQEALAEFEKFKEGKE